MKIRIMIGILFAALIVLLAACGSNSTSSNKTTTPAAPSNRVVHVTLLSSTIQSSIVKFVADEPYTFIVTNKSSAPSDFIIDTRPQGAAPSGTQPKVLYLIDSKQLPPGATKTFTYQFPITAPQSAVQFANELPGPNGAGVRIPVQVTQQA